MGRLDQQHHTFIQALMSRGPLSENHALTMFGDLCGGENGGLPQFIGTINKEMVFLQLEVRAGRNQYNGKLYYGLVNKLGNEQAKLGTRYSHAQIAFFKAVLEAIVSDSSMKGEISGIQALNLGLEIQNEQQPPGETGTQVAAMTLTLAQKEKTLEELAHDHWLSLTTNGMVTLGIRSFLELWNIFKNYDVPLCDVCNEAGIKAQACQNGDCSVRMHDYCLKNRFRGPQIPRICPKCGTGWGGSSGDVPQRDQDIRRTSDVSQGQSSLTTPVLKRPRSSSRRPRTSFAQDAVNLGEE
ncbi:hypothetical protein GOP47_0020588 [Adiantum capillus-veneris]|uniref:Non-structural maintenance of chromosomes element 1 homolog n=1 Tax=Adiantum capillus-veneris TaxID=13818 RepID=A0A9D4UAC9_ADICA|nr:hypothetical protein GOP47_0020588 [Adiantum capillus-veneris]